MGWRFCWTGAESIRPLLKRGIGWAGVSDAGKRLEVKLAEWNKGGLRCLWFDCCGQPEFAPVVGSFHRKRFVRLERMADDLPVSANHHSSAVGALGLLSMVSMGFGFGPV